MRNALARRKQNNEKVGISAEVAVCDIFDIELNPAFRRRSEPRLVSAMRDSLVQHMKGNKFPSITDYVGENGSPYDFLAGSETVSLKTNTGLNKKVCPQIVGQTTTKRHISFFSEIYNSGIAELPRDKQVVEIKKTILSNPAQFVEKYWENLFNCDYLISISGVMRDTNNIGGDVDVLSREQIPVMDNSLFHFTKNRDNWNESTTLKYDGMSLGEFQIHNGRDGVKFRFNIKAVKDIIRKQ